MTESDCMDYFGIIYLKDSLIICLYDFFIDGLAVFNCQGPALIPIYRYGCKNFVLKAHVGII